MNRKHPGADAAAGSSPPRREGQRTGVGAPTEVGVSPELRALAGLDPHAAHGRRDEPVRDALRSRTRQLLGARGERGPHELAASAGARGLLKGVSQCRGLDATRAPWVSSMYTSWVLL